MGDKSDKPGMGITRRMDPNAMELDLFGKMNKESDENKEKRESGPCAERIFKNFGLGATLGSFVGASHAAWYPDPIETADKQFRTLKFAQTNFRGAARLIILPALFVGTAAGTYTVAECFAEKMRGVRDPKNALIGGAAAGAFLGAYTRRANMVAASSIFIGLTLFAVKFSGPIFADREGQTRRMKSELPPQHIESDELMALKEKYPKFKHM